jgi:hypothetical protein
LESILLKNFSGAFSDETGSASDEYSHGQHLLLGFAVDFTRLLNNHVPCTVFENPLLRSISKPLSHLGLYNTLLNHIGQFS